MGARGVRKEHACDQRDTGHVLVFDSGSWSVVRKREGRPGLVVSWPFARLCFCPWCGLDLRLA